jgi:hypothetical protein
MTEPQMTFDVVSPEPALAEQAVTLVPPVVDLEGAVVAELWDYRFRGDDMFPIIEDELRQRFAGIEFIGYEEFGETHAKNENEILESMAAVLQRRGVSAVISAVGA